MPRLSDGVRWRAGELAGERAGEPSHWMLRLSRSERRVGGWAADGGLLGGLLTRALAGEPSGSVGGGTSTGTVLQSGHEARPRTSCSPVAGGRPLAMSHSSMQAVWKEWPHGRSRTSSPSWKGARQTAHSPSSYERGEWSSSPGEAWAAADGGAGSGANAGADADDGGCGTEVVPASWPSAPCAPPLPCSSAPSSPFGEKNPLT